jgi:hypothetical protein
MGVIISIIEICLTQFDYSNKITNKSLLRLGEFNQVIKPFQNGHNIIKTPSLPPNHKTIPNYGQLEYYYQHLDASIKPRHDIQRKPS